MQQILLQNRHIQVCAALIAADCLVFTMVNPRSASAVWLIGGFVLLGMTLFSVAGLFATVLRTYGDGVHRFGRRILRYGAAVCVILVGLQSIGQLTLKDVLTLLPFAVIAYLYFGYGKKLSAKPT